jgi:hypothetical protein
MGALGDKEVEIDGKKISGGTTIKFTFKTALWIMGALWLALGYLYIDLRTEFKEANGISIQEKRDFMDEVEDEYEHKFEKMFDDTSDIKGDVKVMLDRSNRVNPVLPNPGVQVQPQLPPPGTAQPPGN